MKHTQIDRVKYQKKTFIPVKHQTLENEYHENKFKAQLI